MVKALRDNQGKAPISFVFELPKALEALARVFEQGAIKYERGNWKLGGKPDDEYLDSLGRHLLKLKAGEVYDPDTGCLHAAHALWNIAALIELNHEGYLFNPYFDQDAFVAKYADVEPAVNLGPARDAWVEAGRKARNTVDL